MRNLKLNRLALIVMVLVAGIALPLHAMADSDHDRGRHNSGKHYSGKNHQSDRHYSGRNNRDRYYRGRVSYRHDYRRQHGHNRYYPSYSYGYPYGYGIGLGYGYGGGHHGSGFSLTLPLGDIGYATYYDRHRH